MKTAKTLLIKKQLLLGFSLILFIFILVGTISYREINSLNSLALTIFNHPAKVSNSALLAQVGLVKIHRRMKDVVLADTPLSLAEAINAVSEEEKNVLKQLDVIRNLILGAEGESLEQKTRKTFFAWRAIREEVLQHVKNGDLKKAVRITTGKGAAHELKLEQHILELTAYAHNKADGFLKNFPKSGKDFL